MAQSTKQKLMKASDIPAFVEEVIKTGCNICAVGHDKYIVGDADLSPGDYEKTKRRLKKIEDTYGDRDFLKLEIVAYLRSIGRHVDLGEVGLSRKASKKPRHDGGANPASYCLRWRRGRSQEMQLPRDAICGLIREEGLIPRFRYASSKNIGKVNASRFVRSSIIFDIRITSAASTSASRISFGERSRAPHSASIFESAILATFAPGGMRGRITLPQPAPAKSGLLEAAESRPKKKQLLVIVGSLTVCASATMRLRRKDSAKLDVPSHDLTGGLLMKPRISVLTLGVADLERSLAFYRDGLGLRTPGIVGREFEHGAVAFFDLSNGIKLAIWDQDDLAHDSGLTKAPASSTSFSIGHNVSQRSEVDEVMEQAREAGAAIVKPAQETFYGGYAGYFTDPDGHLWEVVWNPANLPEGD